MLGCKWRRGTSTAAVRPWSVHANSLSVREARSRPSVVSDAALTFEAVVEIEVVEDPDDAESVRRRQRASWPASPQRGSPPATARGHRHLDALRRCHAADIHERRRHDIERDILGVELDAHSPRPPILWVSTGACPHDHPKDSDRRRHLAHCLSSGRSGEPALDPP